MSMNTSALFGAATVVATSSKSAVDYAAVEKAFEALKTYDHGASRGTIMAIDDAVVVSLNDAALRKDLEKRLAAALKAGASSVAKDYICSKLSLIGSAESVPVLIGLLADQDLAHAARNALETVPGPEAVTALRDSLPRLGDLQKVGAINSLGVRRDVQSVPALMKLLIDSDLRVAGAAAAALGNIGTREAAQALLKTPSHSSEAIRLAMADACLACSERLLNDGKNAEALAIYKALAGSDRPKQIQLAVKRGLLAIATK